MMPEKDGVETLREILAIDPTAIILTITGTDGAGDHNEVARMLGARKRSRKPLKMAELLAGIRHHVPPSSSGG